MQVLKVRKDKEQKVYWEMEIAIMNKCCASQDEICRNVILFGTKCDGYKERCTLRPAYNTLEQTVKNYQHNLRKMFGAEE